MRRSRGTSARPGGHAALGVVWCRCVAPRPATHAPPLTKDDSVLHFDRSPEEISNRIRGLAPRPGAAATLTRSGSPPRRLKIRAARVWDQDKELAPGEVSWWDAHLLVGTGGRPLEILSAQPEGKKPQSAADLKNGRVLLDGDHLTSAS